MPFEPVDERLIEALGEAVGRDAVLADEADRRRYAADETEDLEFLPELVVRPKGAAEVATVLRLAADAGVAVTPRGAGTGLSGGALPVRGGISLSLERLDRIRCIDRDDMIAEVEAGVVTATLQDRVEEDDLFYPPDPASRALCTVGGNIAEDAAGPRSLRYGSTRRYVLGLEVALTDGELLRLGGRNRKDAAGYALAQLLVGSEGTLGIVTAATLRLLPKPAATLSLLLPFDDLDRAAAAVAALCRTVSQLAACEIVERRALEAVAAITDVPAWLVEQEAVLLVELLGDDDEELLEAAERLAEEAERRGCGDIQVARDAADARRLWAVRRKVGEAIKHRSPYREADTTVPRSKLADLVRAARRVAEEHGLEAICYGHAGDGNLHVNLLKGDLDDQAWVQRRDAVEAALFDRVAALGGTITGEHGVGWTQRRHLGRTVDATAVELMGRIKRAFDPRGTLNPGKIFPDDD